MGFVARGLLRGSHRPPSHPHRPTRPQTHLLAAPSLAAVATLALALPAGARADTAPAPAPTAATTTPAPSPDPAPAAPAAPAASPAAPTPPADRSDLPSDIITTLEDGTPLYRPRTRAVRRSGPIRLDGVLDEPAWQAAPESVMDWQQRPVEGKATGPTHFRVLYDDDAVYVAADMLDPNPERIAGLLYRPIGFRRVEQSDWIVAILAPTEDRSVGYAFAINAAGVKLDYRMTRTAGPDETYNGIWDAALARAPTGWRAEFRIPLSQMRVTGDATSWGFQLYRKWGRNAERNYWSPYPTTFKQELAALGNVDLADRISRRATSIELLPYVLGGTRLERAASADTLNSTAEPEYGVGVDAKVLLGGGLKLTASVNPDFGQIEADPSEVNLTDRETFFSERRPLFIEDADLYQFAIGRGNENLFYSRRIGARPHFSQAAGALYVDETDVTTIYGAAKLSGPLPGGFRVGALSAIAAEERSRAQLPSGEVREAVVEPLTSYNVLQLGRAARAGASDLRLAGTAVHRFLGDTGIDRLHEEAYAGAAQYVHQFARNRWQVTAMAGGSLVRGEPAALLATQRASQRYLQRPDADHVDLDPDATSLAGYAFGAQAGKIAGTWRGSLTIDGRSPGFETNDVGFLLDADYLATTASVTYERQRKTGPIKATTAVLTGQTVTDFSPEVLRHVGLLESETRLRSEWLLGGSVSYTRQVLDTKLLRGGPAVAGVDAAELKLYTETDPRKRLSLRLDVGALTKPASDSWRASAGLGVVWDILPNLELTLTPSYVVNREDSQYVAAAQDSMMNVSYVLGRLEQQTLLARTRLNYTITPRMSLQAYGEPFLSAGRFARFQEAADVRAASYEDRFAELDPARISEAMGQLQIDRDGDGTTDLMVRRPNFQVGSLLTNLVFRWEYRPGSSLFLIWSQSREGTEPDGVIDRGDLGGVFTAKSAHVVLVKLSLWNNL